MMRFPRLCGVGFLVSLLAATLPTLGQDDRFGDITDVVLIEIPVHVSLKGRPVRDLTAADFEVFEGKKKQKIVSLDVFDLALIDPADPDSAIPAASRRNFLFLFDLSNAVPAGIVRARNAAIEMVTGGLHPADLAGVATYTKSKGTEIVLGFTSDRAQILTALEGLGVVQPFERVTDPLRLTIASLRENIAGREPDAPESGNRRPDTDAFLLQLLEEQQTMVNRAGRDIIKNQINDLSGNLDDLARVLDSITGRKQIILFTEGFDSEVVFGTQDRQRVAEIAEAVEAGEVWKVDSEERFGAGDAQASLLSMLDNFRRSDCAVHTVDSGGLRAAGDSGEGNARRASLSGGHDGLFMIANQTGGQFYRNANDLGEAMDDLLDRTSVTYLLTIQPKTSLLDGEYRPLRVKLRNGPKGATVSHRAGYYARRSYRELAPSERQLTSAEMIISGRPGGSIRAHVFAAPFSTTDDEAWVMTAIEIDGSSLLRGQSGNMVPTEVYTYAFDNEGRVRDFFTQAVVLDLYKVGYRMQTGFKLMSHLRLPPGRYELRTLIRNADTGGSALTFSHIDVPDFHDTSAHLLPPFFIEAEERWLIGEGKREGDDVEYPLVAGGDRLIPASRPVLPMGHLVPVLLVGHRLEESVKPRATLRSLTPGGASFECDIELGVRRRDRSGAERIIANLRTPRMPPGDYELQVELESDGKIASNSIPVSIIGTH